METWRFVESDADGELWLKNPTELHAIIAFQAGDKQWQQIMVVTKTWLDCQVQVIGTPRGGRVVFSAMLVVSDGSPQQMSASIDAAVAQGGLEHFVSS